MRRSREREMRRRIFGNGRRTLAATPAPKRKTRFGSPVGGRCPCPRSLKTSRENVALAPVFGLSRIWSVSVPRSLRSQALAGAGSGVLPREDKATAMRVLSLSGEALGVVVGARPFLTADPEGFRWTSPSGPLRA